MIEEDNYVFEFITIAFDYGNKREKEFIDRIEKEAKELGLLRSYGAFDRE